MDEKQQTQDRNIKLAMEILKTLKEAEHDNNGYEIWQTLEMTAKLAYPEHHVRLELSAFNVG